MHEVTCKVVDSHNHPRDMNQLITSEPTQQDFLIDYDILLSVFMSEACSVIYDITYSISNLHRTPCLFVATCAHVSSSINSFIHAAFLLTL
jgi:hypothetical protein